MDIIYHIENGKTIYSETLIRCGNCQYNNDGICQRLYNFFVDFPIMVSGDNFCCWGRKKRKDDENDK